MGNFGDRFERDILLMQKEERNRLRNRYAIYALIVFLTAVLLVAFRDPLLPLAQNAFRWLPDAMQPKNRTVLVQNLQLVSTGVAIIVGLIALYDRAKYGRAR